MNLSQATRSWRSYDISEREYLGPYEYPISLGTKLLRYRVPTPLSIRLFYFWLQQQFRITNFNITSFDNIDFCLTNPEENALVVKFLADQYKYRPTAQMLYQNTILPISKVRHFLPRIPYGLLLSYLFLKTIHTFFLSSVIDKFIAGLNLNPT